MAGGGGGGGVGVVARLALGGVCARDLEEEAVESEVFFLVDFEC